MWLSVLPQILLAAALLLAPGLIISAALRFRSFDALAVAPALSVGVIVIASTAAPFAGVAYGPGPVAAVTATLALGAFWSGRRSPAAGRGEDNARTTCWLVPVAAFAAAALLIAARTVQVIGFPESFSQTYDAVFHLNSVRYALDTGQASSLTIGGMTGGGFYPAGWNAVATLVASVTGAAVPQAVNITSIIIASVFWPLSCLLMTTWIAGRGSAATLVAGISTASLGAFPLLMMDFGVLYPNLLAISILPAGIALAARLLGAHTPSGGPDGLPVPLALLLCLTGLIVSHPTTFMAWLLWTLPMVGFAAYRTAPRAFQSRRTGRRSFRLWVAATAGYGLGFLALWKFLRPPEEAAFWGPYQTAPQAVGEALLVSPMGLPPAWLVAPLLFLGLYACFRMPGRFGWIAIAFAGYAGIFVLVSGFPRSPVRNLLAGVWYNDSYRVAALLPVAAVLLAAVGTGWLSARFRYGGRGFTGRWLESKPVVHRAVGARPVRVAAAIAILVAAAALGQKGGVQHEAAQAATRYTVGEGSPLVSKDELALIHRLEDTVPAGSTLVGNPYTGAALSYALGGRKAAQLHILSYVSPELQEIYDDLGAVASDPDVCRAVRDENAFYVLDFGSKEVHGGNHTPSGLMNLDRNPGVKLMDSQGDAKLYRINACG